jgi:putative nucleotidyltransferase with HDIG domain
MWKDSIMKVLFVDDEAQVLRGLERALELADVDWQSQFVGSGPEALAYLGNNDVDAIVTDMRMPGMDGGQLLERVAMDFPAVVRVVLSGQATREAVYRAINPMHQYLSKPCDIQQLIRTLQKAFALRDVLESPKLRALVGKISRLPSTPELYQQLSAELDSETSSATTIGEIVARDPAMTAKVLQLVNSAVFGLRRAVSSPEQAVALLGAETIKALVLSIGVFAEYESLSDGGTLAGEVAEHSLLVAEIAAKIARHEGCPQDEINNAFTAGLLHDAGKLILAHETPTLYQQVVTLSQASCIPYWQAEAEALGATHASVGAYLFALWGLPQPVVDAVGLHHVPNACACEEFSALSAVTAANYLVNEESGKLHTSDQSELDQLLLSLNCPHHLDVWRQSYMGKLV